MELNKELRELILKAETRTAGRSRISVKGWHSSTDFFKWDAECSPVLKKRADTVATELTRLVAAPTGRSRTEADMG